MEDPFHSPHMRSWRYVLALYIDRMRPQIASWRQFCRVFHLSEKTVKAIRTEFGVHESIGPDARPSTDFHAPPDSFLGENI